MSFAVSRFSTMCNICDNPSSIPGLDRVRLTAIVLNDPTDIHFTHQMQTSMDELNRRTGENFLFFSLIEPPSTWNGKQNPNFSQTQQLFSQSASHNTGDDRTMLYNFLAQIGSFNAPLPGILLTSGNLLTKSYYYIPTSQQRVAEQLIALGDFCAHLEQPIRLTNKELKKLLSEISDKEFLDFVKNPRVSPRFIVHALRLVSAYSELQSGGLNQYFAKNVTKSSVRFNRKKNYTMADITNIAQFYSTLFG